MAVCPKCHASYEPTVRICPADGTPLPIAPAADPNLGTMLEGKYRIDSFISSGGMGSVYRGTHVMLDKTVAIKLIKKELVTTPDIGARFQREARAASNLGHPNIAAVSDFGQTADGTLYLVMEFIKGSSLRDLIQQGGPMDTARIVSILQPIASALARAHRQHIIHRDLKPHNIMLDVDADGGVTPKLLDFGIAKTFDESASQLTMTGFALGTPQYMSPEQATGKQVDGRSDIYSLGIVLYEMLIGEVPFSDTSLAGVLLKQMTEAPIAPSLRRPDLTISPVLEAVVMRCLEKDPEHRFQNAEELHAALEQAKGASATEASTVRMGVAGAAPDADSTVVLPRTGPAAPTHVTQPRAAAPPPPLPPPLPSPTPKATVATMAAPMAPVPTLEPAVAPKKSGVNIWIPVAAGVALLALVVGALGLRKSSTPAATESTSLEGVSASTPTGATTPASSGLAVPGAAPAPAAPAAAPRAATATPAAERQASSSQLDAAGPSSAAVPPATVERPAATLPAASAPSAAPGAARPAQAPAIPENPSVFVQCSGPGEVCGPMRAAFGAAASQDHMTLAGSAGRADVVLSVGVEILDERATQSFGTTFVTRSYSAQVEGESKGNAVPMPAGRTFSFDATVGRERAAENARMLASDAVDKVREYWDRQRH